MHLRAFGSFLLPVLFAIVLVPTFAFPQSPGDAELQALNARVTELYQAGKYNEAIPLAERYAAGAAARYGENAAQHAAALSWLADLFRNTNRRSEAEPLYRRALAIDEKSFGDVARDLNNLASLLQATNCLAEAEPLMRRARGIGTR